jgi:homogentisate phytyltransferase/homogentisate geranylgeranyltransferase
MALVAPWLTGVNRPFLIGSHLLVLALLWGMSLRVPHPDQAPTTRQNFAYPRFYQFIWKLFFLQYLMFPLACWLA